MIGLPAILSPHRSGKWRTQVRIVAEMTIAGKKILFVADSVETECRFWLDVHATIYYWEKAK